MLHVCRSDIVLQCNVQRCCCIPAGLLFCALQSDVSEWHHEGTDGSGV